MRKTILVLFLMTVCAAVSLAQSASSLQGRFNVLDTSNGDVKEKWKKVYDFSTQGADSAFTTTSLATSGVSLTIGSNESWWYDYYAVDSASAATGIKFGFDIPSGATIAGCEKGSKAAQDTIGAGIISADATAGEAFTLYVPTSNYGVYEAHFLVIGGATPGSVIVEALKPTSGTAVIRKGATLIGHRVN